MGVGMTFYATKADLPPLMAWLNAETEIAFIMPDGDTRWKVVPQIESFREGKHYLWHIPSGKLYYEVPLALRTSSSDTYRWINDPYNGWDDPFLPERYSQALSPIYMGSYWKGLVQIPARAKDDILVKPNLPISPRIMILTIQDGTFCIEQELAFVHDFFWRANYFRSIGSPAHPDTEKWWGRFKRWFTKQTVRIPDVDYSPKPHAFPNAAKLILS